MTTRLAKALLLLASLFPLQVEVPAPVADRPQVQAQPHRGPGLAAQFQAVEAGLVEDIKPQVHDPLDLQALDMGSMTILEPTVDAPKASWRIIPEDPGFLVVDGGKRAVFAPAGRGTWHVVLSWYVDGDDMTRSAIATISRGVVPPGPGPIPPDVPTPPTPDPVVSGQRWVVIIHETSERSAMLAQTIVGLRSGPSAKYLTEKGHKLTILDDDAVDGNGKPSPAVTGWRAYWDNPAAPLKLPVILIAEKDSKPTKVVFKAELAPGATDEEVIELVKKAGG